MGDIAVNSPVRIITGKHQGLCGSVRRLTALKAEVELEDGTRLPLINQTSVVVDDEAVDQLADELSSLSVRQAEQQAPRTPSMSAPRIPASASSSERPKNSTSMVQKIASVAWNGAKNVASLTVGSYPYPCPNAVCTPTPHRNRRRWRSQVDSTSSR